MGLPDVGRQGLGDMRHKNIRIQELCDAQGLRVVGHRDILIDYNPSP